MKTNPPQPTTIVEWSPAGIRAFSPETNQLAEGKSVGEVLAVLGNPRTVGIAMSRRHAFVRAVRLPDVGKAEALNVLRLQIDQYFPVAGADLAYDLAFLDDVNGEGRLALVVASRVDMIRQAHDDVAAAGAKIDFTVPAALGSALLAKDLGLSDALVVEETPDGLVYDVVQGGHLAYSRVAGHDKSAEEVQSQIQRTLAAAKIPAAEIVLAGKLEANTAARKVQIPTLELLANRFNGGLNLVLPEVAARTAKKQIENRRRLAVLLWACPILAACMIYMDRDDAAKKVAEANKKWQRQIKSLQTREDQISTRLGETGSNAEFLTSALTPKQYAGDVVGSVVNLTPGSVWLTGINFERGRPLQVRGTAKTNAGVAELVTRMSGSPRFRDVKLVFTTNGKIEEESVIQFAVSAHVIGNMPLIEKKKVGGKS